MRKPTISLLVVLLLAPVASGKAGAEPRTHAGMIDLAEDCSATPPAAYSVSGVLDDGHDVSVELIVLLDGVKKSRAQKLIAKAAIPYSEINVELKVALYRRINITPDAAGSPDSRPTVDAGTAFDAARVLLGGGRPDGIDVVHILTRKDITLPNYGGAPTGAAECAGGVQWDDKAFAISEDSGKDVYSLDAPGITQVADSDAKTVAHEVGHLLGAIHQDANCQQGVSAEDATGREPSPCTVMIDVVDLASLRFSVLEAAVIRGYALEFADS